MSLFRFKNRVLAAKVETTPGVDAVPTVGSNAVYIEDPRWPPNLQTVRTNEATGSLDTPAPTPAGGSRNFTGRTYIHGAGTAGQPVDYDALLQGATFGTRATAAAVTGTAQAGAAATITLAAGASAVDNFYKGMMISLTGGTGSGQLRPIIRYVGSTKVATVQPNWTTTPDATSAYSILANYRYATQSASLKNISVYGWARASDGGNAKLGKILGAAFNPRFNIAVGQACSIDWTGQGTLVGDADVTDPGAATFANTQRFPFINANVYLGQTQTALSSLSFDLGNQISLDPNPNQLYGYDAASVTSRSVTGTITPPRTRVATNDWFTSWANASGSTFTAWWGPAAGQRVLLVLDGFVISNIGDQDVNGNEYDNLSFSVQNPDDSVYLSFW